MSYSVETIDEAAAWNEHDRHWESVATVYALRSGATPEDAAQFA
jgi:hypothetical protein